MVVNGLSWEPNFEKTRWFLVLRLAKPGSNGLNRLLQISNTTAARFDQPSLYANTPPPQVETTFRGSGLRGSRSRGGRGMGLGHDAKSKRQQVGVPDMTSNFHISIAWSLEAPSSAMAEQTRSMDISRLKEVHVSVKAVKVKIGNIITSHALSIKPIESQSLIGS